MRNLAQGLSALHAVLHGQTHHSHALRVARDLPQATAVVRHALDAFAIDGRVPESTRGALGTWIQSLSGHLPWRVPTRPTPFGAVLEHGIQADLVIVMHRGKQGWQVAGSGHAALPHQVYAHELLPLLMSSQEIIVAGIGAGGRRVVWLAEENRTGPAASCPALPTPHSCPSEQGENLGPFNPHCRPRCQRHCGRREVSTAPACPAPA